MADSEAGADRRDTSAADRDDAADQRDIISDRRDETAARRDAVAARCGEDAHRMTEEVENRLGDLRQQLLDQVQGIDDLTSELADPADTALSGGSHHRVDDTEHRHLTRSLRDRVIALIDDLHNEIRLVRSERDAAGRDRQAAAQDRLAAALDRSQSAHDRASSARDRSQAVIERERADPSDLPEWDPASDARGSLRDRVAQAVSDSERHLEVSRVVLAWSRLHVTPRTSDADAGVDGSTSSAS